MAIKNIQELKEKFISGAYPIQQDFWDWLDSYFHKNDKLGIEAIEGLAEYLNENNSALLEDVNKIIVAAQNELQLERRIALTMERSTQVIPVGETMTIYRAKGSNISKLEVKPNDVDITEWTEIPLNKAIDIILDKSVFEYQFRITQSDPLNKTSSIYLLAKMKTT